MSSSFPNRLWRYQFNGISNYGSGNCLSRLNAFHGYGWKTVYSLGTIFVKGVSQAQIDVFCAM